MGLFRRRLSVMAVVVAAAGLVVSMAGAGGWATSLHDPPRSPSKGKTPLSVAGAEDWPMYLHDPARSSTTGETILSAQNASQLQKVWSFTTGGGVAASPTVVGGVVYVGSWDGYEYALNASTGALIWKTYLGITDGSSERCYPPEAGVTSSAAVVNGVVYVGGGDNYWYALSASTGAVLWSIDVGNPRSNTYDGHYNWASPLVYNGYAYIGIASFGDCPLVQGGLLKVDLSTHQIVATWNAVPNGQVGGGVWTSPTLDTATNTIYLDTGTQAGASQTTSAAMVALDANTLALEGAWQVPLDQQVSDNDWGNTPTLIGGGLVVATNKNGVVYAFQRSNISAGPVWQSKIANGGPCPNCGDGSVSSDAFDGSRLYAGGAEITSGGTTYPGSITAFNPTTGQVIWDDDLQGYVIPALTADNGLLIAGVGNNVMVFNAATGGTLFNYATEGSVYSPASVSGGMIYIGSQDGNIYAFGHGSLSFRTRARTLTAGKASGAMQVGVSSARQSALSVGLSSSSSEGQFSTSPSGPWSSTLTVSIPGGQTTSRSFYYEDTRAGSPLLTASASGPTPATQTETVSAAALATISLSPMSASLAVRRTQSFAATGRDAYGNSLSVANASWSTSAPGSVNPARGSSTIFTAGTSPGNGSVMATVGHTRRSARVTVTSGTQTGDSLTLAANDSRERLACRVAAAARGTTNPYSATIRNLTSVAVSVSVRGDGAHSLSGQLLAALHILRPHTDGVVKGSLVKAGQQVVITCDAADRGAILMNAIARPVVRALSPVSRADADAILDLEQGYNWTPLISKIERHLRATGRTWLIAHGAPQVAGAVRRWASSTAGRVWVAKYAGKSNVQMKVAKWGVREARDLVAYATFAISHRQRSIVVLRAVAARSASGRSASGEPSARSWRLRHA